MATLVALTAAFAMLFASGVWFGAAGCVAYLLAAALLAIVVRPELRRPETYLLYGLLVVALGIWAIQPREIVHQTTDACRSTLRNIGLALRAYADDHGSLPPAYLADDEGRPMHSWRVLVLPYLGRNDIYDQYDFNEPWNSLKNQALGARGCEAFRCPSDASPAYASTSYLAMVGSGSHWNAANSLSAGGADGHPHAILVVEVADSGVHWMEPRDLLLDCWSHGVNQGERDSVSSRHRGGAHAVFSDGQARWLPDSTTPEELRALCSDVSSN
jgi:hypothetical protein